MFAGSRLLLPVSINFITLVPKPGRKEGHAVREPSLLSGIAVLRRSGSRKKRRPPVAARGGGAGAMDEQVGRKARCRAPGTRRGGCHPRGSLFQDAVPSMSSWFPVCGWRTQALFSVSGRSWMTHAPVVGAWAWLRCDLVFPFWKDWHPVLPPVPVSLAWAEDHRLALWKIWGSQ